MLFGFADVPYTTPNAASVPNRTNTWSPPPSAVVGPVSCTSWSLIGVAARAAGVTRTAMPAVAISSKPMTIAFAFMENRTSWACPALEGPFEAFPAIVNPDYVQILGARGLEESPSRMLGIGRLVSQGSYNAAPFRMPDEDPDARSHGAEGLRNRVRRLGGRWQRPRELVWSHGRRGIGRRGASRDRHGRELLRHRGRVRMGP